MNDAISHDPVDSDDMRRVRPAAGDALLVHHEISHANPMHQLRVNVRVMLKQPPVAQTKLLGAAADLIALTILHQDVRRVTSYEALQVMGVVGIELFLYDIMACHIHLLLSHTQSGDAARR